ncbi:hypothetical protein G210_3796, partial [Candida maltosa Xu316]
LFYENSRFSVGQQYEYSYFSTRWSWDRLCNIIKQNSLPPPKRIRFEDAEIFLESFRKNPEMFENSQIDVSFSDNFTEKNLEDIFEKMNNCKIQYCKGPLGEEKFKPLHKNLLPTVPCLSYSQVVFHDDLVQFMSPLLKVLKIKNLGVEKNEVFIKNRTFFLNLPTHLTELNLSICSRGDDMYGLNVDLSNMEKLKKLTFNSWEISIGKYPPKLDEFKTHYSVILDNLVRDCSELKSLSCLILYKLKNEIPKKLFKLEVGLEGFLNLTTGDKKAIPREYNRKKQILEPDRCFELMKNIQNLTILDGDQKALNPPDLFPSNSNMDSNLLNLKSLSVDSCSFYSNSCYLQQCNLTKVDLKNILCDKELEFEFNRNLRYLNIECSSETKKIFIKSPGLQYLKLKNFKINILGNSTFKIPATIIELDVQFNSIEKIEDSFNFGNSLKKINLNNNYLTSIPQLPRGLEVLSTTTMYDSSLNIPKSLKHLEIIFLDAEYHGNVFNLAIDDLSNLEFLKIEMNLIPPKFLNFDLNLLPVDISHLEIRKLNLKIINSKFTQLENLQKLILERATLKHYIENNEGSLIGPNLEQICYIGEEIDNYLLSNVQRNLNGNSKFEIIRNTPF